MCNHHKHLKKPKLVHLKLILELNIFHDINKNHI